MTVLEQIHPLLHNYGTSLGKIVVDLLLRRGPARMQTTVVNALRDSLLEFAFGIISAYQKQDSRVNNWIQRHEAAAYTRELHALVDTRNGWHFSALHASADQIEDFRLDEMGAQMEKVAPRLYVLLNALMRASQTKKRNYRAMEDEGVFDQKSADALSDPELWAHIDGLDDESAETMPAAKRRAALKLVERQLKTIRHTVCYKCCSRILALMYLHYIESCYGSLL